MSLSKSNYLDQVLSREKVFRDPVHDYIHIQDRVILDLVNSREFQRLRRIKQLGTSSYTFHGAEHSRFNHSLGVYEITRRIINNFVRNYPCQEAGDGLWDDSQRMVALCAALLHDIGHGPFSHTFEGIFQTNHEALTQEIILSDQTEVNQILRAYDPDLASQVAQVINKTYPNQQVVQLISSQIDADRMDYLLRDAYYAGVSYGQFDLTRILRVIRPYQNQIVFDYAGMHAVEDYIVSRYQMYMQVYFHPVSRGMEELLQNLLRRAKYCYTHHAQDMRFDIDLLLPFLEQDWTLEDYLKLDDHLMSAYFTHWLEEEDPILQDLAYRFLNRKPLKSMLITQEAHDELVTALHKELVENKYDPDYYLCENSSYDLPYDYFKPYQSNNQKVQIDLITKTGQVVELSQVSALVNSLAGRERGDHRLYFPREILYHLQDQAPEDLNPDQRKIVQAHAQESQDVTFHIQQRLF